MVMSTRITALTRHRRFPVTLRGRGRDRDAALALLLHPVHGRFALVHLADFVVDARVKQNALGRRGLPGVNVGNNTDVANVLEVHRDRGNWLVAVAIGYWLPLQKHSHSQNTNHSSEVRRLYRKTQGMQRNLQSDLPYPVQCLLGFRQSIS
jgi:hypothetical protein